MLLMVVCIIGNTKEVEAGTLSMRGVWVSCFEFYKAGLAGKSETEFVQNADKLFANIRTNGCNAVFFHVRSYDDAIYPSSVTGWSKYILDGKGVPSYDPLELLVNIAHKHGIKFHAWMNPYRVTKKKTLNPASASTTNRIVKQVKEILNNYAVDGIHFDDYFYSGEKKYKKVSKAQRMKNVNNMVAKVHKEVKKKGKIFGISPAGNVTYCEKIGADVATWLSKSGYVDYIAPQLYWSDSYKINGKKKKMFQEGMKEWQSMNTLDIPMYVGLAVYKAGEKMSDDTGWRQSSFNLSKQVNQIRAGNAEGYILFSYLDLYRAGAKKEMKNLLANIGTLKLGKKTLTLSVGKSAKLKFSASPSRLRSAASYKSANKKIATVSAKGTIKAKKAGKVSVYVYYGKKRRVCRVTVKKK